MPRDNVHYGGWEHRDVHNINGATFVSVNSLQCPVRSLRLVHSRLSSKKLLSTPCWSERAPRSDLSSCPAVSSLDLSVMAPSGEH